MDNFFADFFPRTYWNLFQSVQLSQITDKVKRDVTHDFGAAIKIGQHATTIIETLEKVLGKF